MKILRSSLLLLVFFAIALSSQAQIAVGPKAGINLNSFRGDETYDVVPGFNVGAFGKYPVLPFLTARAEVLYMQQGANLIDYTVLPNELSRSKSRVKFHNIQIPVLAEFGLPSLNEDNLQPKLLLGAFYSYTVYARETYDNILTVSGYDKIVSEGYSDFTPLINRGQFGLIGALAANTTVKSIPVSIEFRYQYNANRLNIGGTQQLNNLRLTHEKWGDVLNLSTVSINIAATLHYF